VGAGYTFLTAVVGCAALIIATKRNPAKAIIVRKTATPLLIFLTYFLFKVLLDIPDSSEVKGLTIGTSGGLIFALALGIMVSMLMSTSFEQRSRPVFHALATLSFLALCMWLAVDTYKMHIQFIRDDIFLVDTDARKYQRPGNFVAMVALLASLQFVLINAGGGWRSSVSRRIHLANLIVYLILMLVLLLISQLIGSNMGFVFILTTGFATLLWLSRPRLLRLRWARYLVRCDIGPVAMFRKSIHVFLLLSVFLSITLVGAGVVVLSLTNLEVYHFRIFGFSDGTFGARSLMSRMDMLSNNFLTQFAYNPAFGDLNVDSLTTGKGTYAHSLVSVFSHLGIVGAVLFGAYLWSLYKELRRCGGNLQAYYSYTDVSLFRIIAIGIVLGLSLAGTFFTWMPLWFTLGLLFSPLAFRNVGLHSLAQREFCDEQSRFVRPVC
jgi:hypothetical protein